MKEQNSDTQKDRNFDDLAERFSRTIYATPRGQLRLMALEQDFSDCMLYCAKLLQKVTSDVETGKASSEANSRLQSWATSDLEIIDNVLFLWPL